MIARHLSDPSDKKRFTVSAVPRIEKFVISAGDMQNRHRVSRVDNQYQKVTNADIVRSFVFSSIASTSQSFSSELLVQESIALRKESLILAIIIYKLKNIIACVITITKQKIECTAISSIEEKVINKISSFLN